MSSGKWETEMPIKKMYENKIKLAILVVYLNF